MLFDIFSDLEGENNYSFPPPSPPCSVVPLFELPLEITNPPTLNGGDRGGVWILLFSEVTLFEYNVSTILSPVVGSELEDAFSPPTYKWIHSIASSEVE